MISSVGSSSSIQYQTQVRQETTLTDDQKTTLDEILAKYDSENMTEEDMKAMMDEIKAANIPPSKDLKEIMDAAGFEPPKKPEGEMPPPPDDLKEIPDFMLDFMEKEQSGELTQEDVEALLEDLQARGFDTTGALVDEKS